MALRLQINQFPCLYEQNTRVSTHVSENVMRSEMNLPSVNIAELPASPHDYFIPPIVGTGRRLLS